MGVIFGGCGSRIARVEMLIYAMVDDGRDYRSRTEEGAGGKLGWAVGGNLA
jgi:hypothetical protein